VDDEVAKVGGTKVDKEEKGTKKKKGAFSVNLYRGGEIATPIFQRGGKEMCKIWGSRETFLAITSHPLIKKIRRGKKNGS